MVATELGCVIGAASQDNQVDGWTGRDQELPVVKETVSTDDQVQRWQTGNQADGDSSTPHF